MNAAGHPKPLPSVSRIAPVSQAGVVLKIPHSMRDSACACIIHFTSLRAKLIQYAYNEAQPLDASPCAKAPERSLPSSLPVTQAIRACRFCFSFCSWASGLFAAVRSSYAR